MLDDSVSENIERMNKILKEVMRVFRQITSEHFSVIQMTSQLIAYLSDERVQKFVGAIYNAGNKNYLFK